MILQEKTEGAMKPGYWIGVMAVLGAILGHAISAWTGWLGGGWAAGRGDTLQQPEGEAET